MACGDKLYIGQDSRWRWRTARRRLWCSRRRVAGRGWGLGPWARAGCAPAPARPPPAPPAPTPHPPPLTRPSSHHAPDTLNHAKKKTATTHPVCRSRCRHHRCRPWVCRCPTWRAGRTSACDTGGLKVLLGGQRAAAVGVGRHALPRAGCIRRQPSPAATPKPLHLPNFLLRRRGCQGAGRAGRWRQGTAASRRARRQRGPGRLPRPMVSPESCCFAGRRPWWVGRRETEGRVCGQECGRISRCGHPLSQAQAWLSHSGRGEGGQRCSQHPLPPSRPPTRRLHRRSAGEKKVKVRQARRAGRARTAFAARHWSLAFLLPFQRPPSLHASLHAGACYITHRPGPAWASKASQGEPFVGRAGRGSWVEGLAACPSPLSFFPPSHQTDSNPPIASVPHQPWPSPRHRAQQRAHAHPGPGRPVADAEQGAAHQGYRRVSGAGAAQRLHAGLKRGRREVGKGG